MFTITKNGFKNKKENLPHFLIPHFKKI